MTAAPRAESALFVDGFACVHTASGDAAGSLESSSNLSMILRNAPRTSRALTHVSARLVVGSSRRRPGRAARGRLGCWRGAQKRSFLRHHVEGNPVILYFKNPPIIAATHSCGPRARQALRGPAPGSLPFPHGLRPVQAGVMTRLLSLLMAVNSAWFAALHVLWALGWRWGTPDSMASVSERSWFLVYDVVAAVVIFGLVMIAARIVTCPLRARSDMTRRMLVVPAAACA